MNWLLVARRLRRYSAISGDAITVPDFLSNRFHEKKKIIMGISAGLILVFFTVYAGSCFVTCGKLFSTLFGVSYHTMMIVGAIFVVVYTFIGGFLAESASDFMQAVVMIIALLTILILGTSAAGGIDAVIENAAKIPGYLSPTAQAAPVVDANGVQQAVNGAAQFGEATSYGPLTIISTLSWGLGYFGVPQVLLRFMAIRKEGELKRSRRMGGDRAVFRSVHRHDRPGAVSHGSQPCYRQRRGECIYRAVPGTAAGRAGRHHHGRNPGGHHQLFGFLSADRSISIFQEYL